MLTNPRPQTAPAACAFTLICAAPACSAFIYADQTCTNPQDPPDRTVLASTELFLASPPTSEPIYASALCRAGSHKLAVKAGRQGSLRPARPTLDLSSTLHQRDEFTGAEFLFFDLARRNFTKSNDLLRAASIHRGDQNSADCQLRKQPLVDPLGAR